MALSAEERRAQKKAWARANPEKVKLASLKWRNANLEKSRARIRKNTRMARGIVDAPDEARTGQCPLCLKGPRKLMCDHDDATGRIRGWLCTLCNSFLGKTDDEAAAKAARILDYIKKAP